MGTRFLRSRRLGALNLLPTPPTLLSRWQSLSGSSAGPRCSSEARGIEMEIIWILPETVLAIHSWPIAEHGGSDGLQDEGFYCSALARPRNLEANGENVDLLALAAAHAFGIAKNHPFIYGNKPTALVVMRIFLALNKANLGASPKVHMRHLSALAKGRLMKRPLPNGWASTRLKTYFRTTAQNTGKHLFFAIYQFVKSLTCSNNSAYCFGVSAWAPSQSASSGQGWTSMIGHRRRRRRRRVPSG